MERSSRKEEMINLEGKCASCGKEMSFRLSAYYRWVDPEILKRAIETEDNSEMCLPEESLGTLEFSCDNCKHAKLSKSDLDTLSDHYQIIRKVT